MMIPPYQPKAKYLEIGYEGGEFADQVLTRYTDVQVISLDKSIDQDSPSKEEYKRLVEKYGIERHRMIAGDTTVVLTHLGTILKEPAIKFHTVFVHNDPERSFEEAKNILFLSMKYMEEDSIIAFHQPDGATHDLIGAAIEDAVLIDVHNDGSTLYAYVEPERIRMAHKAQEQLTRDTSVQPLDNQV